MIARDEGSCIAEALASVKDLADEMIVVDTGSVDDTALIATRWGARVYTAPWENDFSGARNLAISKARCRWVLVLDADEALSSEALARIGELARAGERAAYAFEQRTYLAAGDDLGCGPADPRDPMSRGAVCFADRQVRLFPNEPSIRYSCEIHEHLDEALIAADMPVMESGIVVHHYGRIRGSGRVHRKALLWCALGRAELEAYPAHPYFLYELDAQFIDLGLPAASKRHCAAALAAAPSSWRLWNAYGLAHARTGERDRAVACFRKGILSAGESAELFNNMGVALMDDGEGAEALLWFERALAVGGDDPDILRNAASACALAGDYDLGRAYISRSLEIEPFAAYSHAIQAELMLRAGDGDGARCVLERLRFLPDASLRVYIKIIHIHMRMHSVHEAFSFACRAIEAYPDRDDLLYLAGKIAELRGENDCAASLYRRALTVRPGHTDVLTSLGCLLERQERYSEALSVFREALRHSSGSGRIEVNLGIVYDKLGRFDAAAACFARAMEAGERSGFAFNAIGCHNARLNRFDEALTCFARAVELEAGNPLYYRNLGLVYERMRLYANAAEVYERMYIIDPPAASSAIERLSRLAAAGGAPPPRCALRVLSTRPENSF